jgi:hypothetical protein
VNPKGGSVPSRIAGILASGLTRKLALSLVPLLFLACDREPAAPDLHSAPTLQASSQAPAADGAELFTYRLDFPISWDLTPTDYPCLSETIHVTGTYQEHLVFVTEPNGEVHLTVHQTTDNVTAVGLSTGDTYHNSGPLTLTANGLLDNGGNVEFTLHNINHFVGPGSDSNIYLRTLIHVTFDRATDVAKVVVFKDDVLCN